MDPYFFLSYAKKSGPRVLVQRFYDDLCQELRVLRGDHGVPMGQPFLDVLSIQVGQDWHSAICDALGNCRTMVALYAPDFFRSDYCGREWKAFADRQRRHREAAGVDARALIPVLWDPVPSVPSGVADIQYDNAEFGDAYQQVGLRRLLQSDPGGEYRRIVELLARQVNRAAEHFRIPPSDSIDLRGPDAAGPFPTRYDSVEPGSHVKLIVAARTDPADAAAKPPLPAALKSPPYGATPLGWNPYATDSDEPLVRRASRLLEERGFSTCADILEENLGECLEEALRQRQVVILLVDIRAAHDEPCEIPLRSYDRANHPGTGAIVPSEQPGSGEDLSEKPYWEAVRQVFPLNWMRSTGEFVPLFQAGVDHASFDGRLHAIVTVAQNNLFAFSEPTRLPASEPPLPLPVLRVPRTAANSSPAPDSPRPRAREQKKN